MLKVLFCVAGGRKGQVAGLSTISLSQEDLAHRSRVKGGEIKTGRGSPSLYRHSLCSRGRPHTYTPAAPYKGLACKLSLLIFAISL